MTSIFCLSACSNAEGQNQSQTEGDKAVGFSKEDLSASGRWVYSVLSNGAGTQTENTENPSAPDIPDASAKDNKEVQSSGADGKGSASEGSDTSGISDVGFIISGDPGPGIAGLQ